MDDQEKASEIVRRCREIAEPYMHRPATARLREELASRLEAVEGVLRVEWHGDQILIIPEHTLTLTAEVEV